MELSKTPVKTFKFIALASLAGGLSACGSDDNPYSLNQTVAAEAIVTYANIAEAMYSDALADAEALKTAVSSLVTTPTPAALTAAKDAYVLARQSYQQTEYLRFDEGFVSANNADDGGLESVDAWEGQVNAWPLDEALIDYVDGGYNGGSPDQTGGIVGNTSITVNGETKDTTNINKDLLVSLNEIGGSEANVATGFHAVEFLLWGQDGSQALSTPGQRSHTDYLTDGNCSNGNCDRRGDYINAAAGLIVDDLTEMVAEWDADSNGNTLRSDLLGQDIETALERIFFGLGSLALGETASERMRVARLGNSPEDEHDCFSDTTHNSYYYNILGIKAAYTGSFTPRNASVVTGTSLADLVATASNSLNEEALSKIDTMVTALQTLYNAGQVGQTFDYLIDGNNDSNGIVLAAENSLIAFTETLENGADALGIAITSDGGSQF